MSVNISAASLHNRVGRPNPLSLATQMLHFPMLCTELGYEYLVVSKTDPKHNSPIIHCLRIPQNTSSTIINCMQWYCHHCNDFPCQWRARTKHLKKCKSYTQLEVGSPFRKDDQFLLDDLMKDFSLLDIEEIERFCAEHSQDLPSTRGENGITSWNPAP